MIISIVGTDGSGKSSSARFLSDALRNSEVPVATLDKWDIYDFDKHPECRFLQSPLPLLRKCISEMPGAGRAMFIFWSIYISMSKANFNDETVFVLDGYWMKHFATETVFGVNADWIRTVAEQLPEPDLTILLHVDPHEAYRRKEAINDFVPYEFGLDPEMKKDNFLTHQAKVQNVLLQWAKDRSWVMVNANRPQIEVREDILSIVHAHERFQQTQAL